MFSQQVLCGKKIQAVFKKKCYYDLTTDSTQQIYGVTCIFYIANDYYS